MPARGRPALALVDGVPRSKHPLYATWTGMRARCEIPSCSAYKNYGGRGITVCDEWRTSFEQFVADMGPKPTPDHSIDRINPEWGYRKDNCRWATPLEQARNKRGRPVELGPDEGCAGPILLRAWMQRCEVSEASAAALILGHRQHVRRLREFLKESEFEWSSWRPNLTEALAVQRVTGIPVMAWLFPSEVTLVTEGPSCALLREAEWQEQHGWGDPDEDDPEEEDAATG